VIFFLINVGPVLYLLCCRPNWGVVTLIKEGSVVSNYSTQHFTRLNLSYISNILARNICDGPKSNLYLTHFVAI